MNMFKKNGGFTLVELIVVIAILAILAAVAIPAYSGYITKAQDTGDTTALASIKTAAQGALATVSGSVTAIDVDCNDNGDVVKVTVTAGGKDYVLAENGAKVTTEGVKKFSEDFFTFMNNSLPTMKGSFKTAKGATWSSTGTNANKWIAG